MVVSEGAINNIMGGMENTAGVRLHSHRHKLKQRFDIIRKLGQGTYGKVQLAINKDTEQEVAIKTIKKAKIETEQDLVRIRREIQIMSSVQHPQIIHIYEVFENREKMVLVMEYAAGGELYDYLSERKVLPEHDARRIFRQVSSAVYYCHKHKICHRDLKLENILLDLDGNAKIADFGLSNVFDDKHKLDTFCGSPLYASPEIVKGIKYTGPEVDCWSLGVLLYTLVYGAMPFDGSNFRRLVKQITQGDFYEPSSPSTASELIRHMLTVNADERASIEVICDHWWVNEGYSESCLKIAEALANQTPVRLDLLLSLAPKHINSEHMLIQPEEDDASMRSVSNKDAPKLQIPPPPPTETPSSPPAARSQSLGAVNAMGKLEIEQLIEKKRKERADIEKKRQAEEAPVKEKKKKKESDSMSVTPRQSRKSLASEKPPHASERDASIEKKSVKKKEGSSDRSEKKKTTKRRDSVTDMEVSEGTEKPDRKKSVKKKESSVEKDTSEREKAKGVKSREMSTEKDISESEKPTKKKVVKKRDTSRTRESSEDKSEKKKTVKKKESSREKSISKSPLPPEKGAMSVISDKISKTTESEHTKIPTSCDSIPTNTETSLNKENIDVPEPNKLHVDDSRSHTKHSSSGRSISSAGSADGTLIGSNSSIARKSKSPKPSVDVAASEQPSVIPSDEQQPTQSKVPKKSSKLSQPTSPIKTSTNSSSNSIPDKKDSLTKVNKITQPSKVKENKKSIAQNKATPSETDLLQIDTEKILQETAEKIKRAEEAITAQQEEQDQTMMTKTEGISGADSTSSKESSQHTSVMSTPARSRTGSESSSESRSSRPDGSRRQSKIFTKAALWDNMINQNNEKPAPPEKPRQKRVGGLNMSDLTKKFEDKSSGDRKSVVLPSVKVSDARRAFESKPGEKSRKSSLSGGSDSSLSKDSSKEKVSKGGVMTPSTSKDGIKLSSSSSGTKEKTKDPIKKQDSFVKDQSNKIKDKSPSKEGKKEKSPSVSKLKSPSKDTTEIKGAETQPIKEKNNKSLPDNRNINTEQQKQQSTKLVTNETTQPKDDVVVAELNLKLGNVGTIQEVGTSRNVLPGENSDSSDSESEAERVLRLISEKREKLENVKREKLRKASEVKEIEPSPSDMPVIKEEAQSKSPSKSPDNSDQKYATLPKGFKTKYPVKRPEQSSSESLKSERRDSRSVISPSKSSSQDQKTSRPGRFDVGRTLVDTSRGAASREGTPLKKEVQAIPPSQVLSPTPREEHFTSNRKVQDFNDTNRKKSEMEIVLDDKSSPLLAPTKQSSYAEIQLRTSTPSSPKTQEFKTEVRHSISSPRNSISGEPTLHRARRERIIPIMMEDEDDLSLSEHSRPSSRHGYSSKGVMPPSAVGVSSAAAEHNKAPITASPESIRKSKRERIIPIAVEGEGVITPPLHEPTSSSSSTSYPGHSYAGESDGEAPPGPHRRSQHPLPRSWSRRLHRNNSRGRGVLEHSESFSSAGEDEEDEEDGFQILTAENLFSTLLNRVRALTRKMNTDEPGGRAGPSGSRRTSQQPTPEPQGPPGSSGFWSQLYSPPRDSPTRISEPLSPHSQGSIRGEDSLSGMGSPSPFWSRSMSRDPSDVEGIFSDPSTSFSTLPRGWRSRWSGDDGGESDNSESLSNRSRRKVSYSRGPSRDLHKIIDDERDIQDNRPTTWSSSTLPSSRRSMGRYEDPTEIPLRTRPDASGFDPTNFRKNPERRSLSRFSIDRDSVIPRYSQDRETTPKFSDVGSIGRRISQEKEIPIRFEPDRGNRIRMSQEREGYGGNRTSQPRVSLDRDSMYNNAMNRSTTDSPKVRDIDINKSRLDNRNDTRRQNNSGEAIGRDGGQYNQKNLDYTQQQASSAQTEPITKTEKYNKPISLENQIESSEKTRAHNELKQLVRELENEDEAPTIMKLDNQNLKSGKIIKPNDELKSKESPSSPDNNIIQDTSKENNTLVSKDEVDLKKSPTKEEKVDDVSKRLTITPKTFSFQKTMETTPTILPKGNILIKAGLPPIEKDKPDFKNLANNAENDKSTLKNTVTHEKTESTAVIPNSILKQKSFVESDSSNKKPETRIETAKKELSKIHTLNPYMRSKTTLLTDYRNNRLANSSSAKSITGEQYIRGKTEDIKSSIASLTKRETNTDKFKKPTDSNSLRPSKTESIIKSYRRSRSRDMTPAIEAAGEKFNQLNSSTLKKISPFEAYRKSKSRELAPVLDLISKNQGITENVEKNNSTVSTAERAKSPFEKAKSSIEKKLVRAKSPMGRGKSPFEPKTKVEPQIEQTNKKPKEVETETNVPTPTGCIETSALQNMSCMKPNSPDDFDNVKRKDTDKTKKNLVTDGEKPKSMYKLITSKFNRSQSNVPDDAKSIGHSEDENSERDDKFKLKRPSRFMKNKAEKSSSKSNLSESEIYKCEESDRNDKKPSRKISDAFNKFLGRKPEENPQKCDSISSIVGIEEDDNSEPPQKPPRNKINKMSESQENMNIRPESIKNNNSEETLESVTANICNHINQLEADISKTNILSSSKVKQDIARQTPSLSSITLSDDIKRQNALKSDKEAPNRSVSLTESKFQNGNNISTEYQSPISVVGGHTSETEDESVMDRITRKSYYSRFQEAKKKPKLRKSNTKESVDQQLAVAKARLQQEDLDKSRMGRDTFSPPRYYSQRSSLATSPPPYIEGVTRRETRSVSSIPRTASLPPEDGLVLYMGGGYRGSSVQPDPNRNLRLQSLSPEKSFHSPIFMREKEGNYDRVQEAYAAAVAAGAAAGAAAANIMKERETSKEKSILRETQPRDFPKRNTIIEEDNVDESITPNNQPILNSKNNNIEDMKINNTQPHTSRPSLSPGFYGNMNSVSNTNVEKETPVVVDDHNQREALSPGPEGFDKDAIVTAREELTRRLTPLTRLSNIGNKDSIRPYRRTYTTGRLGESSPVNANSLSPTPLTERPAYRRTNTMDLPPADARVRPGSEYRKYLQEPSRRYSTAR